MNHLIKIKYRFPLAFLMLMCFSTFFTQQKLKTPGYLGKRFTLELNMGSNINLSTKLQNRNYDNGYLRLNFHPEVSLAYAVSKRIDVGIRFGYDRVKTKFNHQLVMSNDEQYYYYDLRPYTHYTKEYVYFQVLETENVGVSYNFQIHLRLYNLNYIAPLGFYHQFSLGVNQISYKNNAIEGYFSNESFRNEEDPSRIYFMKSQNEPSVIQLTKHNIVHVSYGLYNKKALKNGAYITVGAELNLLFKRYMSHVNKIQDWANKKVLVDHRKDSFSYTYNYYYPAKLVDVFQLGQLVEFKLGIGKIF